MAVPTLGAAIFSHKFLFYEGVLGPTGLARSPTRKLSLGDDPDLIAALLVMSSNHLPSFCTQLVEHLFQVLVFGLAEGATGRYDSVFPMVFCHSDLLL